MLDNLFKFPIVMVDGNKEEERERQAELYAMESNSDTEMIMGEAECPYQDFVSISDRWLPTDESYNRALIKKFDACSVVFLNSGSYVVPWPKEKFKKELKKFIAKAKANYNSAIDPLSVNPNMQIFKISKDQLLKELNGDDEREE